MLEFFSHGHRGGEDEAQRLPGRDKMRREGGVPRSAAELHRRGGLLAEQPPAEEENQRVHGEKDTSKQI